MSLVPLREAEREFVAQILSSYWKERGMSYDVEWAKNYLIEGHKSEIAKDEFFVLKENDEVVGVISLITDVSGIAEIRDMVIKEEKRGRGLGKQLLQGVLDIAKEQKLRKVFGLIFPKFEEFYKGEGFEKEGLLKSHYAEGEDLVIMSKFL